MYKDYSLLDSVAAGAAHSKLEIQLERNPINGKQQNGHDAMGDEPENSHVIFQSTGFGKSQGAVRTKGKEQ